MDTAGCSDETAEQTGLSALFTRTRVHRPGESHSDVIIKLTVGG